MTANGTKNRALLVALLAAGRPYNECAHEAGVSVRTIGRLMADTAFKSEVAAARNELVQRIAGRLADAGAETVKTLVELRDGAESEAVRLGAARSVLEYLTRLREHVELADRLAGIEAALADREAAK